MINRFFFLLTTAAFIAMNADFGMASDSFPTYTQHTPMEPKPASLENSYQIAAICFLGGNCNDSGKVNKGDDDMTIDSRQQCKNEGFLLTSCLEGKYPQNKCPYNNSYFSSCGAPSNQQKCENEGYSINCEEGKSLNPSSSCPYDANYQKCVCTNCSGFNYTQSQAAASGYETDGSCNSCGTITYKRKPAECSGYKTCECGGAIGAATCKSGTNTLYSSCKECPTCDDSCNGSRTISGLSCSKTEVKYYQSTGCGNACYTCCTPSCNTEDGDMIGACGEGRYMSDYNFDGPIYKKIPSPFHYGENSGNGNCGNACWTCWPGLYYKTVTDIVCSGSDKNGWTMTIRYDYSCIMADGIEIPTDAGGARFVTDKKWRTKENCEIQKSKVLSQASPKAQHVAYCKSERYINRIVPKSSSDFTEHNLITTALKITVGD